MKDAKSFHDPNQVTLRPRVGEQVRPILLFGVVFLILCAVAILFARDEPAPSLRRSDAAKAKNYERANLFATVAFGSIALVFLVPLLSRLLHLWTGGYRLVIHSQGVEVRSMWFQDRYDWLEVRGISIRRLNFVPHRWGEVVLHVNRAPDFWGNRGVHLPFLYGKTPQELVALLIEHARLDSKCEGPDK